MCLYNILFPLHYFICSLVWILHLSNFLHNLPWCYLSAFLPWEVDGRSHLEGQGLMTLRRLFLVACRLVQPFPAADCNKYCLCKTGWCAVSLCSSAQPLSAVRDAQKIKPVPINPEEQHPGVQGFFLSSCAPVWIRSDYIEIQVTIPVHRDSEGEEGQAFPNSSSTKFSISLKDLALK